MKTSSSSPYIVLFLHLLLLHLQIAFAYNISYSPLENIALNCGTSSPEPVLYDGRSWTGDADSQYESSDVEAKSLVAKASMINASVPEVPYMSARVFHSQFTYRFNVTPGPKFIRLHFYPTSYLGLDVSKAFVSVTAGNFTLLHNLSVSLTTDYMNKAYLMKEFIIHVSGRTLELTFTPSSNASDVYAFVNGIEVVSMPSNLYIQGDNAHIPLVGHDPVLYYIYNDSAMETMHRINAGGDAIPAKYDSGLFRTWLGDDEPVYFPSEGVEPGNMTMPIMYRETVPPYLAPELVYRTALAMNPFLDGRLNLNYNLSWFFSVDSGFNYLVRLHFCDVIQEVTSVNQVAFTIYLNNQTAMDDFDVIAVTGGPGVPVYLDFVVVVPETTEGKKDLWLDLYPSVRSKPQYYTAFLNGAEVFKLSKWDGNLAGVNPVNKKSESFAPVPHAAASAKTKKITFIIIGCGLSPVALGVLILFFLIVYRLKLVKTRKISWHDRLILIPNQVKKAHKTSRHHFSLDEIRVATNNFDEALVVGIGGFGKVYKASFDHGSTFVAIKGSNPRSEQGALEFETEIHVLSQLRHHNLVSLLGHCKEDGEMILAYEYMSNGTLFDHLHLRSREELPLSWIQRLEICIGVARGLHYLHTGTEHKIIHRDIKTSNILLDHNWVAKISDFGLSKVGNPTLVSTNVKGSAGYLDPEYFRHHKLTEKSDVYSFGVVLLEVISARPAVNPVEDDDEHGNLADWALYCCENGITTQLVEPHLEGNIEAESFETYIGVVKKCLAEKGVERPTMSEVLQSLLLALQLQRNANIAPTSGGNRTENSDSGSNSDLTPGIEFSEIMIPIGR
ncbi:receptor-like protein kinase FERONIA [Prosopis cineraria]|uniref:receptor-like protein kinase FERONIA n=1 Tax=Prosopis cineraria TaxID=364024 RepID=UPI00240F57BE|nr:receptor-like protein kinase FERONIA [Prosopis cineraria]